MLQETQTARILDGKALSKTVRQSLKEKIDVLASAGKRRPGLTVVLAGDNPASEIYVKNKIQACKQVGIESQLVRFDAGASETEILACIEKLNADDAVDGILVQLPLPQGLSSERILGELSHDKDVDGLHTFNLGLLFQGKPGLKPCTPLGIITMLEHNKIELSGKRAVVIGRSNLVGKPIAGLLIQRDATVTVCHSKSKDLAGICREADVLVVAAGRKKFVPGDWIKPGACVIDVGIHHDEDGAICGDVDFAAASQVAGAITPVPGGVGPMTVAMLLSNTLLAYEQRTKKA